MERLLRHLPSGWRLSSTVFVFCRWQIHDRHVKGTMKYLHMQKVKPRGPVTTLCTSILGCHRYVKVSWPYIRHPLHATSPPPTPFISALQYGSLLATRHWSNKSYWLPLCTIWTENLELVKRKSYFRGTYFLQEKRHWFKYFTGNTFFHWKVKS